MSLQRKEFTAAGAPEEMIDTVEREESAKLAKRLVRKYGSHEDSYERQVSFSVSVSDG